MPSFDVVTTFADKHWHEYAKRCVETFKQHWGGIPLTAYNDFMLEAGSEWLGAFKTRHASRVPDNFRFDAVRFSHKVAALELAYKAGTADYLIWMDADCITHSEVTDEWLSGLIGNADFAYLRRAKQYPECGFLIIRRNAVMDEFMRRLVDLYKTDKLFELSEWHDSWAIEQVRKGMAIKCASLSGGYEATGHPFINGPLGAKLDHCKGKRKALGKSKQSDLKTNRKEAYWNGD